MLQFEPLFKRAGEECEQHRNENGTEGQDKNVEEEVKKCEYCKYY